MHPFPGHEVHPQPEYKCQFLGQFLLRGLDFEVDLDSRQLFCQKVHPQTKSWLRLCRESFVKSLSLPYTAFSDSSTALQRHNVLASGSVAGHRRTRRTD